MLDVGGERKEALEFATSPALAASDKDQREPLSICAELCRFPAGWFRAMFFCAVGRKSS